MTRVMLMTAVGALALSGCGRSEVSGPPTLRLGRDMCEACGMLVNEDRCSSGMLIERDGRRVHALFDDIGCMIDYERGAGHEFAVVERYVHDHQTRAWIALPDGHFVVADERQLRTPMSSGIIALRDRAAADEAASRHAGRVATYEELTRLRATQAEERRRNR